MSNNKAVSTQKNYVLFVHAKCKGSQEAISMLNGSGLNASIEVQNVAQIPARMLPEYVTGVPTVVDLRAREVHRGSACVNFIQQKIKEDIPAYGGGAASGYGSFEDGALARAGSRALTCRSSWVEPVSRKKTAPSTSPNTSRCVTRCCPRSLKSPPPLPPFPPLKATTSCCPPARYQ